MKTGDAAQAWILVTIIGTVVAVIAWCIDVVQEWMSDLKQGYCSNNWLLNRNFCCWETKGTELQKKWTELRLNELLLIEGECRAWRSWSSVLQIEDETESYLTSMFVYTAFGVRYHSISRISILIATLLSSCSFHL